MKLLNAIPPLIIGLAIASPITIMKELKGNSHTITRLPTGGLREDIDQSVNIIMTNVPGDAAPDDEEVEVTDPRVIALIEEDSILGGGKP